MLLTLVCLSHCNYPIIVSNKYVLLPFFRNHKTNSKIGLLLDAFCTAPAGYRLGSYHLLSSQNPSDSNRLEEGECARDGRRRGIRNSGSGSNLGFPESEGTGFGSSPACQAWSWTVDVVEVSMQMLQPSGDQAWP